MPIIDRLFSCCLWCILLPCGIVAVIVAAATAR